MRKFSKIFRLLGCALLLVQLTSCELLDFDVNGDLAQVAAQMKLNFDTAYVYRGFVVNVIPTFEPDSLNISDIYVRAEKPEVVEVNMLTGRIEAVGAGWTRLFVESVSAQLKDTCTVCVMDPWEVTEETFPYETIFYADATVGGQPLTEDMTVAAFIGDECRAIAEVLEFHGVTLLQMRLGAENIYDDTLIPPIPTASSVAGDSNHSENPEASEASEDPEDPEDPEDDFYDPDEEGDGKPVDPEEGVEPAPDAYQPVITFRCYDKKKLKLYECPITVPFDGETHGTLSNLYKIQFE